MQAKVNIQAYENGYMGMLCDIQYAAIKLGLTDSEILPQLAVITGTIEATKTDQLEKIRGVEKVEIARYLDLAPPMSKLQ